MHWLPVGRDLIMSYETWFCPICIQRLPTPTIPKIRDFFLFIHLPHLPPSLPSIFLWVKPFNAISLQGHLTKKRGDEIVKQRRLLFHSADLRNTHSIISSVTSPSMLPTQDTQDSLSSIYSSPLISKGGTEGSGDQHHTVAFDAFLHHEWSYDGGKKKEDVMGGW